MRAIAIDSFGGPEILELRDDLPDPKVGPDFVLIAVQAAGVNPVDAKIRAGQLEGAFTHRFPLVPGWDAAGVVEAVGPAVRGLAEGDEVFAYCRRTEIAEGTYAERVSVPEAFVARKPQSASWAQAGALPLAGLTAWQALTEGLALEAGESVLITAAAGGVGHLAVQLARSLGAHVFATASEGTHDWVRSLGADHVVDYRAGPVADELSGMDAVLDLVGGDAQADARATLRPGGRINSAREPDPTGGQDGIEGSYTFVRPDAVGLEELARRFDEGELKVELAGKLPLAQAADAHRRIEDGHVHGKLVLDSCREVG